MRIAVVGSGYVGLVAGACFADMGHDVILVDNDQRKLTALQNGEVPIHEKFLPELLGRHRGTRLQFSDDAHGAANHDVLLISGALHYFDFSLSEYLADLHERPRHVLVNRTPLVNAPDAATIQYTHGIMVACKLLNRADLIAGMSKLGYECADSWSAPEFSIKLPYDPGYWVKEYSGLYFRAKN